MIFLVIVWLFVVILQKYIPGGKVLTFIVTCLFRATFVDTDWPDKLQSDIVAPSYMAGINKVMFWSAGSGYKTTWSVVANSYTFVSITVSELNPSFPIKKSPS